MTRLPGDRRHRTFFLTAVRHTLIEHLRNKFAMMLIAAFVPLWTALAFWSVPGTPTRFRLRATGGLLAAARQRAHRDHRRPQRGHADPGVHDVLGLLHQRSLRPTVGPGRLPPRPPRPCQTHRADPGLRRRGRLRNPPHLYLLVTPPASPPRRRPFRRRRHLRGPRRGLRLTAAPGSGRHVRHLDDQCHRAWPCKTPSTAPAPTAGVRLALLPSTAPCRPLPPPGSPPPRCPPTSPSRPDGSPQQHSSVSSPSTTAPEPPSTTAGGALPFATALRNRTAIRQV
ncbi:hypothetical protein SRIMM317S_04351 [Streptomyces rimosus subsp. rimosus]